MLGVGRTVDGAVRCRHWKSVCLLNHGRMRGRHWISSRLKRCGGSSREWTFLRDRGRSDMAYDYSSFRWEDFSTGYTHGEKDMCVLQVSELRLQFNCLKFFFASFQLERYLTLQPNEQWGRLVAIPGERASVPPDGLVDADDTTNFRKEDFDNIIFCLFSLRFAEIVLNDV
uniref:F-box protein n=1 Tax=Ascaris lumbricoides TaxID=6252 RepID=A0A0M3I279_ASCLU